MAQMKGQQGEVFFGDPDAPLPNWRDVPDDDPDGDDLDKPLTKEQRKALVGILGFDPSEKFKGRTTSLDRDDEDVPVDPRVAEVCEMPGKGTSSDPDVQDDTGNIQTTTCDKTTPATPESTVLNPPKLETVVPVKKSRKPRKKAE